MPRESPDVRRWLAILVLLAALPAVADARVAVVATSANSAALLDITTNTVVARPAVGAATTAAAFARDGSRAYVAGGRTLALIEVGAMPAGVRGAAALDANIGVKRRATLPADIAGIAISPAGGRIYVAAGPSLHVLDARSLRRIGRARLRGQATALALSQLGTTAAVALRSGRVALVDLGRKRLVRRVRARGVRGLAWDRAGRVWVVQRTRVAVLPFRGRKLAKRRVRLPRGAGGAAALSPDGATVAIGAAPGGRTAALLSVATRRVRGLRVGAGPGAPGWSPDGVRVYFADGGAGGLSLVSPFAARRIGSVELNGARAIAVQPGLARVAGTDAADNISGTRLRDLIEGLGR